MRRADRLFQIIQIFRRHRRPLTAGEIAAELETSVRTVYRDIADLMAQRVPIRGEAGVGYVMEGGYDMPPLMLTQDEVEAAVLGAQWVASRGDPTLSRAARDLVSKINATVPARLRSYIEDPVTRARPDFRGPQDRIDLTAVRKAIREGRKITISYSDEQGRGSRRTIWPITLGFLETARILVGWCELRQGFRHFRTDRIGAAVFEEEPIPERPPVLRKRWLAEMDERRRAAEAQARSGA
ncbi:helix-turn-helix transcriptional regulator [Mycoplana rhizolycopersici]|uniref:YafY family transcriptional regulator n=1 Tax=Mycoplana rhizolycopersici TaxID=2746702 RepID=A0ABX2QA07_9HYPH|nr:YafY family protein [Rhizobium rhizolycopersici]NVP54548.1 YafY family transcriptional regulator [Rhizobium rhizolycopersici]